MAHHDTITVDAAVQNLEDRLRKLDRAVLEGLEVERVISAGVRDTLAEVERDPLTHIKAGRNRLRSLLTEVGRTAREVAERNGFRLDLLERYAMESIGQDAQEAGKLFEAVSQKLRAKVKDLSADGNRDHEDGVALFTEALARAQQEMELKEAAWHRAKEGRGRGWTHKLFHRDRLPDDPHQDTAFVTDVAQMVRVESRDLEEGLSRSADGACRLSLARYYGEVLDQMEEYRLAAQALAEKARALQEKAAKQADALISAQRTKSGYRVHSMIDEQLVESMVEAMGMDGSTFLAESNIRPKDLLELSVQALEERMRQWIDDRSVSHFEVRLVNILGGDGADPARARESLTKLLSRAQPPVQFNDEYQVRFAEGRPVQYFVLVQPSDPSADGYIVDACNLIGLSQPMVEPLQDTDGRMELSITILVAGIPLFAQMERLISMMESHRSLLASRGITSSSGVTPLALRDSIESERLPEIAPQLVEDAIRRQKSFHLNHMNGGDDGSLDELGEADTQEDPLEDKQDIEAQSIDKPRLVKS